MVSRVVGFKKIKFYTNENVGSGELDLPEQQMHTTSYWLTLPRQVMATLPYSLEDRRDGVVGLAFAMRQVAQLLLMCDRQDIGISIGAGDEGPGRRHRPTLQDLDEPRVFIYDSYPGGIGFSEPLFAMHDEMVARTRELIAGCPCDHGCPTCVGPVGETGPEAKPVALLILDRITGARGMSSRLESRLREILRERREGVCRGTAIDDEPRARRQTQSRRREGTTARRA